MTASNDRNRVPATSVTTWKIDPEASRIEFTARMRLMFVMKVTVLGRFSDVAGTLTVDEGEPTKFARHRHHRHRQPGYATGGAR